MKAWNESDAEERIAIARGRLLYDQPFFGYFLTMFKWEEADWLPTMATDGQKLYYNKAFVMQPGMTKGKLVFILLHEALHLVLGHIRRSASVAYHHEKANVAQDAVINANIAEMIEHCQAGQGLEKPEDCVMFDWVDSTWSWEAVYEKMPKVKVQLSPALQGVIGECNDANKGESGKFTDSETGSDGRVVFADSHIKAVDEGVQQEVMDKACSAYDMAQSSTSQGHIPGGVKRAIDEYRDPKLDWRGLIPATIVDFFARTDFSYSHPNSLFSAINGEDVFYPKLLGNCNRLLLWVVDTSGSMGTDDLKDATQEFSAAAELADMSLIMSCDAKVHRVDEVPKFANLSDHVTLTGGGGTSFRPPFDYIKENGINPEVMIYITDGYGDFPSEAPPYPVIWCRTKGAAPENTFPKWARSMVVNLYDE